MAERAHRAQTLLIFHCNQLGFKQNERHESCKKMAAYTAGTGSILGCATGL